MNDMDFKRQGKDVLCTGELLLARLMGQYCLAGWLLLSSSNAAGGWAGQTARRVDGRAADTERRAMQSSNVPLGRHLFNMVKC